jgi:RNase P subunit RPR2
MYIRYTKEMLEKAISKSKSWADVCREFGVKSSSGGQTHLHRRAEFFGLTFNHFTGHAWAKGRTFRKKPLQQYLVKKGPRISSAKLRIRLIREGVKSNICECCKRRNWMRKELRLELHHKNRDHLDNRLENLEILCPNCHSQK